LVGCGAHLDAESKAELLKISRIPCVGVALKIFGNQRNGPQAICFEHVRQTSRLRERCQVLVGVGSVVVGTHPPNTRSIKEKDLNRARVHGQIHPNLT